MAGTSMGFLEHLYDGALEEELCFMDFTEVDERKVEDFVQRYTEIVGEHAPAKLEKEGSVPDSLMDALRELGMFGLTIPKQYGGLGFTLSEYLRVVEEMARTDMALVLVPLAHLSIGLKGVVLFGNEEQKQRYLSKAATGEMIFAYALTEPKTGSDAQHIDTVARKEGEDYVISGSKTYITNGNYADAFTVFAQLDPENPGHMGAFIVERDRDGVKVGKDMPKMGLKVSSTTPIQLKDVRVPAANRIGDEGDGFKVAMNILNYGRLGLGAASAGLMKQSVLDMTKRSSSRTQFGVPIRDFELIQEKLVRGKVHAFAAANMTYFTALLLESDPLRNVAMESSHCKLYGTDRCWDTLYDALQTAGGSGYIATQPYEKRMRDFRVTTIFEGTSEIHTIDPPLTIFRSTGTRLAGKKTLGKLIALWRMGSGSELRKLKADHPKLKRALSIAADGEKLFRRLLAQGLRKYGKRVMSQEFYLRRMTYLSLSSFWLVASVASLKSRYYGEYSEEDLALLDYLVAESREVQRTYGSPRTTRREREHKRVFDTIP